MNSLVSLDVFNLNNKRFFGSLLLFCFFHVFGGCCVFQGWGWGVIAWFWVFCDSCGHEGTCTYLQPAQSVRISRENILRITFIFISELLYQLSVYSEKKFVNIIIVDHDVTQKEFEGYYDNLTTWNAGVSPYKSIGSVLLVQVQFR